MAAPSKVLAATTDPGFGSALTVLLAMGVLFVLISGLWQRLGPAWRTLMHGGGGSGTGTAPATPGSVVPSIDPVEPSVDPRSYFWNPGQWPWHLVPTPN